LPNIISVVVASQTINTASQWNVDLHIISYSYLVNGICLAAHNQYVTEAPVIE